jgi:signal transduction histidine kinase
LLIIGLDRLKHELPLELRLQRGELASTLEEANALATDIHGLSHQLHSSKLKHLGLKSALRELCSHIARQHGVDVRLVAGEMRGKLSEERALCLYRVAQEGLTNAVKHSRSDRIDVELTAHGAALQLTVRDFGCGFDLGHYEAGLGIASMRERLRMVGGALQVQTAPGRGTMLQTEVGLERVARHASVA